MKAVLCPVCTGSGKVDAGFYERTSETWTNAGSTEICRACGGKGWVEVNEEHALDEGAINRASGTIFDAVKKEEARRGY